MTDGVGPENVLEFHGAITHLQCVRDDGRIWATDAAQIERLDVPAWDLSPGEAVEVVVLGSVRYAGPPGQQAAWTPATVGDDGASLFSAGGSGEPVAVRAVRRPGGRDLTRVAAGGALPRCGATGAAARPNVLMFGDGEVNCGRIKEQQARFRAWADALPRGARLAVVEIGAGTAVPTIRSLSGRRPRAGGRRWCGSTSTKPTARRRCAAGPRAWGGSARWLPWRQWTRRCGRCGRASREKSMPAGRGAGETPPARGAPAARGRGPVGQSAAPAPVLHGARRRRRGRQRPQGRLIATRAGERAARPGQEGGCEAAPARRDPPAAAAAAAAVPAEAPVRVRAGRAALGRRRPRAGPRMPPGPGPAAGARAPRTAAAAAGAMMGAIGCGDSDSVCVCARGQAFRLARAGPAGVAGGPGPAAGAACLPAPHRFEFCRAGPPRVRPRAPATRHLKGLLRRTALGQERALPPRPSHPTP
jgi:hypothetical protein